MSENNHEAVQRQDLTTSVANVPPEVVEWLGEERVIRVESLAQLASGLIEFSKLPDPFKKHLGRYESFITSEVEAAMNEVSGVEMDIEDSGSAEINKMARRHAPVLKASSKRYTDFLVKNFNANSRVFKAVSRQTDDLDTSNPARVAIQAPQLYDSMESIAADLASEQVIKDFKRVLDQEEEAGDLDAKSVALQRDPKLKHRLNEIWADAVASRNNKAVREIKIREHSDLSLEATDRGRRNWRVRRAHRSPADFFADLRFAEESEKKYRSLRDGGSALHGLITVTARSAAKQPSSDMFDEVHKMKELFVEACQNHPESQAYNDETINSIIATEEYIQIKVKQSIILMRGSGLKLTQRGRKMAQEISENKLSRTIKQVSAAAVRAVVNPYENVSPDPDFRQACRDARDILVGGGRIDRPFARQLAEDLHKLKFGKNDEITLDQTESGLIVGIATDKINSLVSAVDRIAVAESDDAQVEKLRRELPEQYGIISSFDLDAAVSKLKALIEDETSRRRLMDSMPDSVTFNKVAAMIDHLSNRHSGDLEQLEQLDENVELPEIVDDEVVDRANGQNYRLIDSELTNIAEQLEWVVFPPDAKLGDVKKTLGESRIDVTRVNWDRIKHLLYLANEYEGRIYRSYDSKLGTTVPYLVAEFAVYNRRFAVAECPEIGNATYIVDDLNAAGSWEEVMRLNKADARSLGARRIIHPIEEGHLSKIIRSINSMLAVRP